MLLVNKLETAQRQRKRPPNKLKQLSPATFSGFKARSKKMKTKPTLLVVIVVVALLQAATNLSHTGIAGTRLGSISTRAVPQQRGIAVLSVASGFATQPGTANPLAGSPVVLFKESFENFLRRTGMFQAPPGSTATASPLAAWAYACKTGSPVCKQALYETQPNWVGDVKMDLNGRATLPGVPAGIYYVFAVANYNKQFLVWDLRVDLKPGANSITLDQRNTAPLDADSRRATPSAGGNQPVADSHPCQVSDVPRPAKPGARADSTLAVRGAGYVYTYTETNRQTGQVVNSFTERGNFSNTTLYLLDEDAENVFQSAGIKPVIFPLRLSLIESVNFYDAFGEVKNVPGMDILTAMPGSQGLKEELESGGPAKAEFDCAMKAIRSHSVAVMTTDANARGIFPSVSAGTYYLYGRFYRVQKPFRGGGMVWNLRVVLRPGQDTTTLSVNNAAYK
jgi:hypothetical protein